MAFRVSGLDICFGTSLTKEKISGLGLWNLWSQYRSVSLYTKADEPMAHFIYCCPNFFFIFSDQRLCVCVCVCARARVCVFVRADSTYCIWITAVTKQHCTEKCLHKLERCEVLTWYLSLGRRPSSDWANTWHCTGSFTVCFSNRNLQQPSYCHILFLIAFLEEAFTRYVM
jgi:hypothetical protein